MKAPPILVAGFVGGLLAATPPLAWSQVTERQPSNTIEESVPLLDRYYREERRLLSKGIRVEVGSILPGSSLAAGVEYGRDRTLGTPIGVRVGGSFSIRGYREFDLRTGLHLRGYDYRTELQPVDADLPS